MRRIDLNAFRLAQRGMPREINRRIALNLIRARQPLSRGRSSVLEACGASRLLPLLFIIWKA